MVSLTSDIAQLWRSLDLGGRGPSRTLQFIAAHTGEGTSTLARELALYAASRLTQPVWLVSLDVVSNVQIEAALAQPLRFGTVGEMNQASPDGSMFFCVQPVGRDRRGRAIADARYLVAHSVCDQALWITRFRHDLFEAGQMVQILPETDYWDALKAHSGLIIVDCPALDRSMDGLTMAPFMDQTVMVVAADGASVSGPALLKNALTASGAHCVGLVFNRAPEGQVGRPTILQRTP